jgi:hypothetical protein
VIAFANADFDQCEEALQRLTCPAGRATSMPRPGWCCSTCTAPPASSSASRAWRSTTPSSSAGRRRSGIRCPSRWPMRWPSRRAADTRGVSGDVGWVCPDELDIEAVAGCARRRCRCRCPGCSTGALRRIDAEAAMQLSMLFRLWAGQALEMRWMSGDRLFTVLQEAAPTGVRDADPAFWLTRLDALRLVNRPDQFDETAIDYCVTYEVSPPSWERRAATCASAAANVHAPADDVHRQRGAQHRLRRVGPARRQPAPRRWRRSSCRASWSGDISGTLRSWTQAARAPRSRSACVHALIRVDFIAAGDLLNWVLSKRSENRSRALRRRAPPGGAVLRRDGHQRARQASRSARTDASRPP